MFTDAENEDNGTGKESESAFAPRSGQAEVAPHMSAEVPSSCNHLYGEGVNGTKEWHILHLEKGSCIS